MVRVIKWFAVLAILLLSLQISVRWLSASALLLEVGGYGYWVGDLVKVRSGDPAINDLIVYDPFKNESMCGGFGPAMALGRVVGLPGQVVTIDGRGLYINGEHIPLDRDYSQGKAVFGRQKYETVAAPPVTLQVDEYLIDRWIGQQCFADEVDENGSSKLFDRFTVHQPALIGIIVRRVGHDFWSAWEIKQRIY